MLQRRDVLMLGVAGLAASPRAVLAQGPTPAPLAPPAPPAFEASQVADAARALAARPFKPPNADLPEPFANLSGEQYAAIQNRASGELWADDNLGFVVAPLHRGFVYASPMKINIVADGVARPLAYRPEDFDLGALKPPAGLPDMGFSGFQLLVNPPGGEPEPVAVFQGASFYRAIARGMTFGARARGLALKVADTKGEEIPLFREVWIERPTLAQGAIVFHALLDSDSLSGAYRFTLRAGDATIVDTECTLFARVAVDSLGVAPMTATFLAGPIDRRRSDDARPAVHDTSGLRILNGRGEWLWRPVSNRETLQTSAFVDDNPRGFGFIQLDRDFAHYLDDENHWENRPSLWAEPIGDWGPGAVTLIEVPSDSDVNQNMIAYWRPKEGLAANSERSFAYRQFWCWSPPASPPGARVAWSRGGRTPGGGTNGKRRRFIVQFEGDIFADEAALRGVAPNLGANPGAIVAVRKSGDAGSKSCRVQFDLDPGNEQLCELRLFLEAGGKPVSDIWLYRWTP